MASWTAWPEQPMAVMVRSRVIAAFCCACMQSAQDCGVQATTTAHCGPVSKVFFELVTAYKTPPDTARVTRCAMR